MNAFYTTIELCPSIILPQQCKYNIEAAMPSSVNDLMTSQSVPHMVGSLSTQKGSIKEECKCQDPISPVDDDPTFLCNIIIGDETWLSAS
jgi:hypothetical protein